MAVEVKRVQAYSCQRHSFGLGGSERSRRRLPRQWTINVQKIRNWQSGLRPSPKRAGKKGKMVREASYWGAEWEKNGSGRKAIIDPILSEGAFSFRDELWTE